MAVIEKFLGRRVEIPEDRRYDAKQGLWGRCEDQTLVYGFSQPALVLSGGVKSLDWLVPDGQEIEAGEAVAFAITGKILYLESPGGGGRAIQRFPAGKPSAHHGRPLWAGLAFFHPSPGGYHAALPGVVVRRTIPRQPARFGRLQEPGREERRRVGDLQSGVYRDWGAENMTLHELAGQAAPRSLLANIPRLVSAYYTHRPDPSDPAQRVVFGTSGHRGSSLKSSFNEDHILAVSQAICEYRASEHISGPLFMGMDTHALSEPAHASALEVFAANGVTVMIQKDRGYTPTPVISHAILTFNRNRRKGFADGVVITPSHNPPEDGGFKYNPPHGGPAGGDITRRIADRANEILGDEVPPGQTDAF